MLNECTVALRAGRAGAGNAGCLITIAVWWKLFGLHRLAPQRMCSWVYCGLAYSIPLFACVASDLQRILCSPTTTAATEANGQKAIKPRNANVPGLRVSKQLARGVGNDTRSLSGEASLLSAGETAAISRISGTVGLAEELAACTELEGACALPASAADAALIAPAIQAALVPFFNKGGVPLFKPLVQRTLRHDIRAVDAAGARVGSHHVVDHLSGWRRRSRLQVGLRDAAGRDLDRGLCLTDPCRQSAADESCRCYLACPGVHGSPMPLVLFVLDTLSISGMPVV
jgi:hypothetical protein